MSHSSTGWCDDDLIIFPESQVARRGWDAPFALRQVEGNYLLKASFRDICCYCCALTWAIYDYTLTFHDEVAYVWRRPTRAGSLLFYILRYLGILSLVVGTVIQCWPEKEFTDVNHLNPCEYPNFHVVSYPHYMREADTFFSIPALQFSVFWAVELVLQSRVFALYGNNSQIAVFNAVLFSVEIATMMFLWCSLPSNCHELPGAVDFLVTTTENAFTCDTFALYWVPGIAFELWLALLAFLKFRPRVLKHDLLRVMVRDSIRYFFLIAIVIVVHIATAVKGAGDAGIPFAIAGTTIGGSRLVLHLRRAYFRGHDATQTNLTFAAGTLLVAPVPNNRFADETFYVQETQNDDESSESEDMQ